MSKSPFRCIDCGRVLPVVFGRWVPQCAFCSRQWRDVPHGAPDGGTFCPMCGGHAPKGQGFCAACKSSGPAFDNNAFYCIACGAMTPLSSLFDSLERLGISTPTTANLLCRRCFRLMHEWLSRVPTECNDFSEPPPWQLAADEDPCLAVRLRSADATGRGWRQLLQYGDSDAIAALERIVNDPVCSCSAALLTDESVPLPDHVCQQTLPDSCARCFPGTGPGRLPPLSNEKFSVKIEQWKELLRTSPSENDWTLSWDITGTPEWPIAWGQRFVGLVVRRRSAAGLIELRGMVALADHAHDGPADRLFFSDARVQTKLLRTGPEDRRWIRKQEDELLEWYGATLAGQRMLRPVGRKVGSAPLLQQIRPAYPAIIAEACRRLKKRAVDLSANDVALQSQLNGIAVADSTVAAWWREGRLERPEHLGDYSAIN